MGTILIKDFNLSCLYYEYFKSEDVEVYVQENKDSFVSDINKIDGISVNSILDIEQELYRFIIAYFIETNIDKVKPVLYFMINSIENLTKHEIDNLTILKNEEFYFEIKLSSSTKKDCEVKNKNKFVTFSVVVDNTKEINDELT